MRYVATVAPRRMTGLRQYVTRDANAFRRSAGIPVPRPVIRKRFLGGLGCGSCAGACKKNLGDWSDWGPQLINAISAVAQKTVPVIVNDVLGPGSGDGTQVINTPSGPVQTTGLTAAQISALLAASAQAQSPSNFLTQTANIGGINIPYWALGLGGLGTVFLLTR